MLDRLARFALGVLLFAIVSSQAVAQDQGVKNVSKRPPWTTSCVNGTPEPPPRWRVEHAFPSLEFDRPVVLTNAPGTDRLFLAEQGGKIVSFPDDPNCETTDLVVDLRESHPKLTAIYGLTFHPQFADNRFVFVCYIVGKNADDGTIVSRFEMTDDDPPQLDPDSEHEIVRWKSGGHNGGCLKFGPDGYLYISTGDGGPASPPDPLRAGQDVTNLLSSILRIDVDRYTSEAYAIPVDNPFNELKNARPEVWAYGFRNPWKMSFDRETGDLWVGDVGWELWEMVYRVQRGGNYGWSIKEGRQPVLQEQEPGPTPILPPTVDHPHSEAGSITGGFVYRGERLKELVGTYIYGDYQSGIVWGARMDGAQLAELEELAVTPLQLVGFGESNSGELYLLDYQGGIYRLEKNQQVDRSADFPRKLSETGLFRSLVDEQPAPGVIPYSINTQQWSDFAQSKRWMAIPGEEQISIDEQGNWQFPDGSVITKTVGIEMEAGVAESYRRLETQVLHREAGSWRPYTYVWNQEQTEADLADADGFTRVLQIKDTHAPGGVREQSYRFAGRRECSLCHNPWVEARTTIFGVQSASLLGISSAQLDRIHDYPTGSAYQLTALRQMGLLGDSSAGSSVELPFVDPYDPSTRLDQRARSWLHVNCSHCHQFNAGGAATLLLSHDLPMEKTLTLDVRPTQGTFGLTDARIIAPGDPYASVLYFRISKRGAGRMPRLGSHEVDERGVRLIREWIEQLALADDSATTDERGDRESSAINTLKQGTPSENVEKAIDSLTSTSRGALQLLDVLNDGEITEPLRDLIIVRTKAHPVPEIRDLFEKFVPPGERVKRLGDVIDLAELLSLEADAERGKQQFFSESAAACKNCHQISGVGKPLGPELTKIGAKYRRNDLLQHILEPSRTIDPKYVPWLLETKSGRVMTGLLVSEDSQEVVLRDATNKDHRVKTSEIEQLVRQQKSLMPDLLLRDMTKQQVADLLAYLSSLK